MRAAVCRAAILLTLGTLAACGTDSSAGAGSAGLATEFDSTTNPDTVIARTAGAVPEALVRRTVADMRIAPAADDTSLFGETSEFDAAPNGRLFVYDRSAEAIFLFDSTGALLRRIGRAGSGPGEFNGNSGMVALPDGRLAQWDPGNGRLSFFSSDGVYDSSWVVSSGFYTTDGVYADADGSIFLRLPVTERRDGDILGRFGLVRLGEDGAWVDSIVPPDLPVNSITYIAEMEGGMSAMGPRHSPRLSWDWHPNGYFVSASGDRYVIESSRPERALRIVRDAEDVPVSAEERAYDEERVTWQMRTNDPGWTFRGPAIPDTKPPIADVRATRDGRIWAQVPTPSERIPADERMPQRPNGPPPPQFRDRPAYEVFAEDGRFLGRVALPLNAILIEADGNTVWTLERDADGLPAIVRSHVEPAFP